SRSTPVETPVLVRDVTKRRSPFPDTRVPRLFVPDLSTCTALWKSLDRLLLLSRRITRHLFPRLTWKWKVSVETYRRTLTARFTATVPVLSAPLLMLVL